MAPATNSIRVAAKTRLVALLAAREELQNVQVAYAWPGKEQEAECMWIGGSVGPVTIANMRAGRKSRDDTFQLTVHWTAAAPGQTAEEADARAEHLYAGLENLLAEDTALGGLDGVLWVRQNGNAQFFNPDPTNEGYIVHGQAVVEVKSRLV